MSSRSEKEMREWFCFASRRGTLGIECMLGRMVLSHGTQTVGNNCISNPPAPCVRLSDTVYTI